jgi:hypothetical protein
MERVLNGKVLSGLFRYVNGISSGKDKNQKMKIG